MFATIFFFELKRWLKNPTFYIYSVIMFLLAFSTMASALGYFDALSVTTASNLHMNSALSINEFVGQLSYLTYFLLPTIVGAAVYRDFKYNVHQILFSYPFTKTAYLSGKFLSSMLITCCITMAIGLALFISTLLPWANPDLLGPTSALAYVQTYLYFVIPNLLFFGVIVFAVVTLTRNVYVGFISVMFLFVIQGLMSNLLADMDNKFLAGLLDPFGSRALDYYTEYWTVAEQNFNSLPFEGLIVYNRLLWMSLSVVILVLLFVKFEFTQTALTLARKKKGERLVKNNFGGIVRVVLPRVNYRFHLMENLKNVWSFSNLDFRYIVKNWVFISVFCVALIFILLSSTAMGSIFGTNTYPVTWKVLAVQGGTLGLFINLLTFLFAGLLVHRASIARMNFLVDATAVPNWVLVLSKVLALIKMQMLLLLVVIVGGVSIQIFHGYYRFEFVHYFFEIYGLSLIHYVIWALLAVLVQTLFKNYLLGFFTLLVLSIGLQFLGKMGIEQEVFVFNSDSGYSYSDMNAYGAYLPRYFIFKLYWLLLGLAFLCLSLLLWTRGLGVGVKERFSIARSRSQAAVILPMLVFLISFLALGSWIYFEDNIINTYTSAKERENQSAQWEKKYKKHENAQQPRIVSVKVDVDLFPKTRDFKAKGVFVLTNKTNSPIDSLFVNYNEYPVDLQFSRDLELVSKDSLYYFDIYKLKQSLQPGESMELRFEMHNVSNTLLTSHSPVLENGSFINNSIFPSLGYSEAGELTDDDVRKKHGLGPKERMALQTDARARENTYISADSDWIEFETTVSTSEDQIAIAPGYLQKEWTANGRRYFHYKMPEKMLNFYAYNSARYEVFRQEWKGVDLEIYYHKGHEYNLARMMESIKKSLDYYTENFSAYQHRQVRIIEFPRTQGTFAQSFANTIPFSEAIGFIAQVDDADENAVDYPFSVISHEVAHQWWAHQVIGANVQGATMLSESLSEYSSLKVLEREYGKTQMRKFLQDALDSYLSGRAMERKKEKALMYNENQQYIHYNKGSLVFYALSDYIGEKNLNNALKKYIGQVAFQEAPYTVAAELVEQLEMATPDSLKYLIDDMFRHITLYDNKVISAQSKKLTNGTFEVTFEVEVSKYRSDEQGKRLFKDAKAKGLEYQDAKGQKIASLPLADYVEVGVFAIDLVTKKQKEMYWVKKKISQIDNTFTVIVKEQPTEVGIDPYNKLIDTKSEDNRMKI